MCPHHYIFVFTKKKLTFFFLKVWAACELAAVDTVVQQLPAGLNTKVGERGLKLSGGEKQRVAIARTALKRSKILLCDEVTRKFACFTRVRKCKY
jgi:ABC-type transport system involved in Fe-S cluster assembly fused permease/ATPase subunit